MSPHSAQTTTMNTILSTTPTPPCRAVSAVYALHACIHTFCSCAAVHVPECPGRQAATHCIHPAQARVRSIKHYHMILTHICIQRPQPRPTAATPAPDRRPAWYDFTAHVPQHLYVVCMHAVCVAAGLERMADALSTDEMDQGYLVDLLVHFNYDPQPCINWVLDHPGTAALQRHLSPHACTLQARPGCRRCPQVWCHVSSRTHAHVHRSIRPHSRHAVKTRYIFILCVCASCVDVM